MANKDLRDWIAAIDAVGELKVIKGAEPKEEIGGIVDIYMRKMGLAAGLAPGDGHVGGDFCRCQHAGGRRRIFVFTGLWFVRFGFGR